MYLQSLLLIHADCLCGLERRAASELLSCANDPIIHEATAAGHNWLASFLGQDFSGLPPFVSRCL